MIGQESLSLFLCKQVIMMWVIPFPTLPSRNRPNYQLGRDFATPQIADSQQPQDQTNPRPSRAPAAAMPGGGGTARRAPEGLLSAIHAGVVGSSREGRSRSTTRSTAASSDALAPAKSARSADVSGWGT